ncbi:MAG: DUF2953 domain-containing protein, partial [Rhodobacteraceae bacterium]|nr:DUF2953 domain-containing protein [Paracoccaceae bacterium]
PRLAVADSDRERGRTSKRKPKPEPKPPATKATRKRRLPKVNPRRVFRAALRLLPELFGSLRLDTLKLDLRFGSGDPAETGEVYGMLKAIEYGLAGASRVEVLIEPVFDRAVFAGRAALDVTLTPARLIPPIARFGWRAFGPGA